MQDLVSIVLLKAQTIQTIPEDRKLLLEDMRVRGGELHQNLELLARPPDEGDYQNTPTSRRHQKRWREKEAEEPPHAQTNS